MAFRYEAGVEGVQKMRFQWQNLKGKIDPEAFDHVSAKLAKQEKLAQWWKNSCLTYFQQFSKLPIPDGVEKPEKTLDFYKQFDFRGLK